MNTQHDENYNRKHWTGEAWLGIDSIHAPKHGEPHDLLTVTGTYAWTKDSHVQRSSKTYR
jgi:hypothetical protein